MKRLVLASAALLALSLTPVMAMGCCGGGKGKAGMCAKGDMAMNMKSGKKGAVARGWPAA